MTINEKTDKQCAANKGQGIQVMDSLAGELGRRIC